MDTDKDIEDMREEMRIKIEKWKNRKNDEKAEIKKKRLEVKEKKKEETKNRQRERARIYYKENKERATEYNKEYRLKNRECILEYYRKYNIGRKEKTREYAKEYYKNNREKVMEYRRKWVKTRHTKMRNLINSNSYIRGLGFNPLNQHFEGSHFHHMHLNGSDKIGMFIPKKLHRSVIHDGKTGMGMREINKLALLWVCEQSIIERETI